jgi:hypothetical protein
MLLRIPVFWDEKLCQWISGSQCSKDHNAFIYKSASSPRRQLGSEEQGTTNYQNIRKHPSTGTAYPRKPISNEYRLFPYRTPHSDMYNNRHTTKTTNEAPQNNLTRITLTLCPTGSRMFPLCPPTTRSSPATYCALCHSRGLQS